MNCREHPSWDACILITSSNLDNRRFGTGFIICHIEKKSYIVTCAHVISDVGGAESIEADGQTARIVGIGSDNGLDLAVIETDELLNNPVVKLRVSSSAGNSFITAGFRAFGRHFAIAPLLGKVAVAVALESRNYSKRVKAWNLEIQDGEYLHDGYSGSPVIDDETGFCLGVITCKQGDGQVGLAISIEELEKIWATMPIGLIEKASEYQSQCDRLASQAFRFYVTGDLAQALDIYQKIRAIEPFYPRINIMIRSIEEEISKPYIDRQGRVLSGKVYGQYIEVNSPVLEKSAPLSRWRIPVLLKGILVGIVVAVLIAAVSTVVLHWK
jgi:Trypsin-like peptidase domain